jgi:2-keto-4-pentenoate hydratase/2-oxohepta-3-ene-1,7-dioic acid hydratase in catechol pathway
VLTLLPRDLICTGTPPGIGAAQAAAFPKAGDILVSSIERIGRMRHDFID